MKTVLDQSLSIFPFEEDWFDSHGLATTYVGHPFAELEHLDEASKEFYQRHNLSIEYPVLVLLPGSRQQEIDRHWPVFLNAVESIKKTIPNLQVMVGKASNVTINSIPDYTEKTTRLGELRFLRAHCHFMMKLFFCLCEDSDNPVKLFLEKPILKSLVNASKLTRLIILYFCQCKII